MKYSELANLKTQKIKFAGGWWEGAYGWVNTKEFRVSVCMDETILKLVVVAVVQL